MSKIVPLTDLQNPGIALAQQAGAFSLDTWHAMQARDDQLIRDQVLHGYTGREYVYDFKISGSQVTGVSVVGARALASAYGGIKSRLVASVDKTGALFVFKSFEPLAVKAEIIQQLADEPDFYECVVEVTDVKTGNSIQVRKKETKTERRRDGSAYDRPHYDVIAESKAFRNGVLSIIPQEVIARFEKKCLEIGDKSKTIDQYREGVIAFATKAGIALDRQAVAGLTFSEISGLGGTVGNIEAFRAAADAAGILREQAALDQPGKTETPPPPQEEKPRKRQAGSGTAEPGFSMD
jgi:hypothetical protein